MSKATDTHVTPEDMKPLETNNLTDLDPRNDVDITGGCIFCGNPLHLIV